MSPVDRRAALVLALALLAGPHVPRAAAQAVVPEVPTRAERARTERRTFLDMYARSYFPGRSGQIMVVPREGEILTRPGADVPFMHGSPWSYDTRIPILFWGPRYIRSARLTEPATQQDVAPTIAQALGLPMGGVTGQCWREPCVRERRALRPRCCSCSTASARTTWTNTRPCSRT